VNTFTNSVRSPSKTQEDMTVLKKVDRHTFYLAVREFGMGIIKNGTIIKR